LFWATEIVGKLGGALAVHRYGLLIRRRTGALGRLLLAEFGIGLAWGRLRPRRRRIGLAMLRSCLIGSGCRSPCLYLLRRGDIEPLVGEKTDNED
jgi:hypothetical protein